MWQKLIELSYLLTAPKSNKRLDSFWQFWPTMRKLAQYKYSWEADYFFDNFLHATYGFASLKITILNHSYSEWFHIFPSVLCRYKGDRFFCGLVHWFTSVKHFSLFFTQPYVIQAFKRKGKSSSEILGMEIHQTPHCYIFFDYSTFNSSGSHNMWGFLLFWNISFLFFVWSLYVLDDSGMEKDLCLFTEPFALWWMTQPAFSEMHHFLPIIPRSLFDARCTGSRAAFKAHVLAQAYKWLISTIHCLTHCKNNLNSDERNYKFSPI